MKRVIYIDKPIFNFIDEKYKKILKEYFYFNEKKLNLKVFLTQDYKLSIFDQKLDEDEFAFVYTPNRYLILKKSDILKN